MSSESNQQNNSESNHGFYLDANQNNDVSLHQAILENNFNKFRFVFEKGVEIIRMLQYGNTYLHEACKNPQNTEIIKFLVDNGANVNAKCDVGETPLHIAICYKVHQVLQLLLNHGSDPNAVSNDGTTPLHYAAQEGYMEVCALLLKHGAKLKPIDSTNWTPLHVAFFRKHHSCVSFLLHSGADPNVVQDRPLLLVRAHDRDKNLVRSIVICKFP